MVAVPSVMWPECLGYPNGEYTVDNLQLGLEVPWENMMYYFSFVVRATGH